MIPARSQVQSKPGGPNAETRSRTLLSRFRTNVAWASVSQLAARGSAFLGEIYLARVLGAATYGLLAYAQIVTSCAGLLVELGTHLYGIREIAKSRESSQPTIDALFTLRLIAGILVFALYGVVVLWVLTISPVAKSLLIGCGLYLLALAISTEWVFQGLELFQVAAMGSTVTAVSFLAGTLAFVSTEQDATVAALVWSSSFMVGNVFLLYWLWAKTDSSVRLSSDFRAMLSHLKRSLYFAGSGGLIMAYQSLPVFLLSHFGTSQEVGFFAAPYRIVVACYRPASLIIASYFPVLSELHSSEPHRFQRIQQRISLMMLCVGAIPAVILCFFGDSVIGLLLGTQYQQSILLFKIMVWLVPIFFLRHVVATSLMIVGMEKFYALTSLIGLVVAFLVGAPLIQNYAALGGAISVLVTEAAVVVATLIFWIWREQGEGL